MSTKTCQKVVAWFLIFVVLPGLMLAITQEEYHKARNAIKDRKKTSGFYGSDLTLSDDELDVDAILVRAKRCEVTEGIRAQSFPPAKSFFEAKAEIEKSQVFKIIRAMPKGGSNGTGRCAYIKI